MLDLSEFFEHEHDYEILRQHVVVHKRIAPKGDSYLHHDQHRYWYVWSGIIIALLMVISGCNGHTPKPIVTPGATGTVEGDVMTDAQSAQLLVAARVSRADLRGVPNAVVTVRDYPSLRATTDANGHFVLENVPDLEPHVMIAN